MEDAMKTCNKKVNRSRCKTDEERRERYLASHKRYGGKPYTCDTCNVVICQAAKSKHTKTKKHLKKLQ